MNIIVIEKNREAFLQKRSSRQLCKFFRVIPHVVTNHYAFIPRVVSLVLDILRKPLGGLDHCQAVHMGVTCSHTSTETSCAKGHPVPETRLKLSCLILIEEVLYLLSRLGILDKM